MRRAITIGWGALAGLSFAGAEGRPDERGIGVLVEHIAVDSAAATSLLRGLGDSYGDVGLRQRIGFKVAAGGAEVLESTYLVSRSGQRAKIMSWHEIIHESGAAPAVGSKLVPTRSLEDTVAVAGATLRNPTHFRMEPVGHDFEFDSVLGSDLVKLLFASHRDQIVGENLVKFGPQRRSSPRFRSWDFTSAIRARFGRPVLVATHPPAAPGDPASRAVFVFCTAHRLVPPAAVEAQAAPEHAELELTLELIETDAAQARTLYERSTEAEAPHGAIRAALDAAYANGAAKQLSLSRALAAEGKRAKSEPATEYQYPTEFDPPEAGLDPTPKAFAMRALGSGLEVDVSELSDRGMLTVNVSASRVRLDREISFEGAHPSAKQPIFDTLKVLSSVALRSGNDTLIGMVTPRRVPDGEPESKRRVLFVLRADVIDP